MKLSDAIFKMIYDMYGIRHCFTLPGGGIMHLSHSLEHSPVSPVYMLDEQAAAIAADMHGRRECKPGLLLVTTGPGIAKAVMGVAGAYMDSTPLIVISGEVNYTTDRDRQKGIQELPCAFVNDFTKSTVRITNETTSERAAWLIRETLNDVYCGRPGPVWISIQQNAQAMEVETPYYTSTEPDAYGIVNDSEIRNLISKSKRPLIVGGHGVILDGSQLQFSDMIGQAGVPVQNTWNSIDLVPHHHPMYFGRANVFGPRCANKIIQQADLIIGIGAHFGIQHVGYSYDKFAPNAKKVLFGLAHSECIRPDIFEHCFAHEAISFLQKCTFPDVSEWIAECSELKRKYPVIERPHPHDDIDPYEFCDKLTREMTFGMDLVPGSSGTGFTVIHQVHQHKPGQRFLSAKGLSSMGYGIPSAIGSCIASERRTITIEGDGGFQQSLNNLATIKHLNLPIKIFVFNNGGYQSMRNTMGSFFGEEIACDSETTLGLPSTEAIATAYGIEYRRIESIEDSIHDITDYTPRIYEVMMAKNYKPLPKLKSVCENGIVRSGAIDDMVPEVK